MSRKIVGIVTAAVLLVAGSPAHDVEASATASVIVVAGDMAVGAGALPGDGLCYPTLVPSPIACTLPGTADLAKLIDGVATTIAPDNGYAYAPTVCVGSVPCALAVGGTMTGVVPGTTGPACGSTQGILGAGAFNALPVAFGWLASAGHTLPILGTITVVPGDVHQLVGLMHVQPLQQGACVLVPATSFTTVGVIAFLPVHSPPP